MAKLPSFQFYPGDWQKDPNLRRCSHAAKGVWIDLLCLMFECEERGTLVSGGRPWAPDEVCAAVGGERGATLACITELLEKGVARKDSRGAIFCCRMARDEQTRKERVAAGSAGGLAKASRHASSKPLANGLANGLAKPSSSSSSSSSSSDKDKRQGGDGQAKPTDRPDAGPGTAEITVGELVTLAKARNAKPQPAPNPPDLPPELDTPAFRAAWDDWLAHRREIGRPLKPTGMRAALGKCAKWGPEQAVTALRDSAANGWQGIFEPERRHGDNRRTSRHSETANGQTHPSAGRGGGSPSGPRTFPSIAERARELAAKASGSAGGGTATGDRADP